MTPAEVTTILRQFNEWRRGDYEPSEQPAQPDPCEIGEAISEAIDEAIEMIKQMEKMETALWDHHANAMCKGCDHSHPLTQLRLAAYQQSKLYADTVFALENNK